MNLPRRALGLKTLDIRGQTVLALDTGFTPDSLEGLRLVKASRGSGWLWFQGQLVSWTTNGVHQEDRRLLVWGETTLIPPGTEAGAWPTDAVEGRRFIAAFVKAWAARAAAEPLPAFSPSAVVPWKVGDDWAFVFPPAELRGVLDALVPLDQRLAWEHLRHPEYVGAASWAFASAALGILTLGDLPWSQPDEEHLRQELRDLKRTFHADELPEGPDDATRQLWGDAITGRLPARAEVPWKAWAEGTPGWNVAAADPARAQRRLAALGRRTRRRDAGAFWRRRGTLVTAVAAGVGLLALIVGSVVWGAIKPDPTDTWTEEQVVKGYYAALSDQDGETLRKITRYNKDQQPTLEQDQNEATNLFVIRQVRTAYERKSPIVTAADWEAAGKPALVVGQMLYGVAGLELSQADHIWTATYRKWVNEGDETTGPQAVGASVHDALTLVKTDRGWKVSGLKRDRQPLP